MSRFTDDQLAEFEDRKKLGTSYQTMAEEAGCTNGQFRHALRSYRNRQAIGGSTDKDKKWINTPADDPRIHAAITRSEIDMDKFYVAQVRVNQWGSDKNPSVQARAELRPIPGADEFSKIREEFLADIRGAFFDVPVVRPTLHENPVMIELACFDLHLGKSGDISETGAEPCNTEITYDRMIYATENLLSRARGIYSVEKVLIPMGNDMMHFDNIAGTTTGGTPQDADLSYFRLFRTVVRAAIQQINIARHVAPVDVLIIPGNHDRVTMFHLGEVLAEVYRDVEDVAIDNRATMRKYYRYGINLIGFTHGKYEKIPELPLIMAQESGKDWAETFVRHWHIGHVHKRKKIEFLTTDTFQTIEVRVLPSLSGTDAWHARGGYNSSPIAELHVWDAHAGHIDCMSYNARRR